MSASDSLSEASQPLEGQGEEENWDDWDSDEGAGFKSLFNDARFESLEEVLEHDAAQHAFNLRQYRAQVGGGGRRSGERGEGGAAAVQVWCSSSPLPPTPLARHPSLCSSSRAPPCCPSAALPGLQHGLDQVGTIRLVNFIRVQAAAGLDPRPALAAAAPGSSAAPWLDDRYLQARRGQGQGGLGANSCMPGVLSICWAGQCALRALNDPTLPPAEPLPLPSLTTPPAPPAGLSG